MSIAHTPFGGQGNALLAVQILGGDGVALQHLLYGTLKDNLAALATSARTNVNDVVGCQHHVAVVLYHDNGVAQVAQLLERVDEPVVVALMQAY